MTDSMVDAISIALNREFLNKWNGILHYNLDKGMLVAGSSRPRFGGGSVDEPMLLIVGDRATIGVGNDTVDLDSIVGRVSRDWIRRNLRFVDPEKHLRIQKEIGRSAGNLADIFLRRGDFFGANDTSAAVGYAPLTKTEALVKSVEGYVNSADFKRSYPETGEDVKVMGRRVKADIDLTLSIAFVDRFIKDENDYFRKKEEVRSAVEGFSRQKLDHNSITISLNNLDKPGRGIDGTFLTVTGTSAESGDSGQVGRGNRVNGLFSACRPSSSEAASGKNPVSHIGKIYNAMAFQVADVVVRRVDGVREAYLWLLSKIGEPVNSPTLVAAQVVTTANSNEGEVSSKVGEVLKDSLSAAAFKDLIDRLIRGEVSLC